MKRPGKDRRTNGKVGDSASLLSVEEAAPDRKRRGGVVHRPAPAVGPAPPRLSYDCSGRRARASRSARTASLRMYCFEASGQGLWSQGVTAP